MLPLKTKNYFFLFFLLILMVALHFLGWLRFIEFPVQSIIVPISTTITKWRISTQDSLSFLTDKDRIVEGYNACRAENQNLEAENGRLKNLEAENEELRSQLNFFNQRTFSKITAEVVGRNTDSLEKMIIINIGEQSDIKPGQPVIAGSGLLVGVVAKVEKNFSMVRLINDNQSKIAATILNKDKSLGVVEGGYGLSIKMNFIPRNETVLIGDKIITSGLEKTIPRGLLIGEVAVAENEAYQPFQQAVLTSAADLSKITVVSVLTSL